MNIIENGNLLLTVNPTTGTGGIGTQTGTGALTGQNTGQVLAVADNTSTQVSDFQLEAAQAQYRTQDTATGDVAGLVTGVGISSQSTNNTAFAQVVGQNGTRDSLLHVETDFGFLRTGDGATDNIGEFRTTENEVVMRVIEGGTEVSSIRSTAAGHAILGDTDLDGTFSATGLSTLNGINNQGAGITQAGTVSGVTDGAITATSTEAINGSQLFATNQAVGTAQATADDAILAAGNAQSTADLALSDVGTALNESMTAQMAAEAAQGTADTAITNAAAAQNTADAALANADTAQMSADNAGIAAAAAQGTADTALANAATAQGTADTALANAATAQGTADTALANAATAQGTADTALANAATAQTAADNAGTAATAAQGTADTALANAATAQTAADNAGTAAAAAQGTADTALTNAATAQTSSATALTTAQTAETNSATALTTAQAAQSTANGIAATANTAEANSEEALALAANSVQYDSDVQDTVTFGPADAGPVKLRNVAAGMVSTDAVNLGQLNAVRDQVTMLGGRIDTLESSVNNLRFDIREVEKVASRGVAITSAMTAIPSLGADKKMGFGMGVGHYNGETAVSATFGFRGGENTEFRINAGTGGGGDVAVSGGGMFSW